MLLQICLDSNVDTCFLGLVWVRYFYLNAKIMKKYNPKDIEKKWQKYWEDQGTFKVKEVSDKQKFYGLIEFPYPSGAGLHVGHPRPFTAMDVISRKKRMEEYNVLFPIGFDAFGLPTENFAIKTGRPPKEVTAENIATFTRQLKMLGFSFDWSRAVDTTDPKYYKWTQWIFLQFFKHGLAYKKAMPINWCPSCKIGLANEEVVDGKCERCGTPVERKNKEQWMLAITKYADKLLEGLKTVNYIERAKVQQENWIGKSEGALVRFAVNGKDIKTFEVFTTRPDTLFGATYMVIAPEHELITKEKDLITNFSEVEKYISEAKAKSDLERTDLAKEKTGVELKGIRAINPVNNEELPIFVADYVLASYGTGAIMAVPAHDERDNEFARKFNLPIKPVVIPLFEELSGQDAIREDKETVTRHNAYMFLKHHTEDKYLCLDWEKYGWHSGIIGGIDEGEDPIVAAVREIQEETGYQNVRFVKRIGYGHRNHFFAAHKDVNRYALGEDMLFELVNDEKLETKEEHTKNHKPVWVEAKKMREFLNMPNFLYMWDILEGKRSECFSDNGIAVNSGFLNELKTPEAKEKIIAWLEENGFGQKEVQYRLRDWVFSRQRYWGEPIPLVNCSKCGWVPVPEKELPLTLPEVERYEPTDTGESPLAAIEDWVKTTCPKCGHEARRETDTMPNWAGSSWYFLRYCDPDNDQEFCSMEKLKYWMPVDWYNGGMEHTVLHLLYSRFWNQFLFDLGLVPAFEPYTKRTSHGMILAKGGEKMSKSKGNVVNPDEMVEQFGTDALRTYIMFMGPFDQAVEWDTNGLIGVRRFLDRVYTLSEKVKDTGSDSFTTLLHQTIRKVTEDIDEMRFNTAIAKLMELTNEMVKAETIGKAEWESFLKLLSPFAPHLAEELWNELGHEKTIAYEPWPKFDLELAKEKEITLAVQINGKLRDTIVVVPEIEDEEAKQLALRSEKVQKWLEGKEPKKVIYVKGKLVSIVV